ncbi:DUF4232 domain-containing protein [Streptomyces corynorhini]|uniref:DUF4232 domain-containing protein n=1 Tax=Streptomyces corynorhini TaxID=2282652 RepID=A0A370BJY7_9ACTN|nr:DUF4232 domain-containing protein [Streptomyces corynorhini]RDG39926.1 DUF4232 domain-containing protein [Streptomyces corynorhini]
MRINRKIAVSLVATVLAGTAGVGAAQAAPAAGGAGAPSACRPANHLAKITQSEASSGHSHYRVTLTAPSGYAACELAGSPTDVRFSNGGKDTGITAGSYGSQQTVVTFGPGHPVHFDIQVPNNGQGKAADEASFTLAAPGGEIPGTSFAEGTFQVAAGTVIGPVQSGA